MCAIWSKGDYEQYKVSLQASNLEERLRQLDANDGWDLLSTTLSDLTTKHIPSSSINKRRSRMKPLWMNEHALRKVKNKQKSYRRYQRTRDPRDYADYITHRNKATKAVRNAIRDYESNLARESKTNPKGFWSYYKSKTKPKESIPTLVDNLGNPCTTDKSKADALNNFFCSVFTP